MILDKNQIKDFDGNNFSKEDMIKELKSYLRKDYLICIGSDSQVYYEHTVMVTSVVVINRFKGNNCFYVKDNVPNAQYPTLRSRIMDEAFRSVEVALELREILGCPISIHLDIGNDPEKNATHKFFGEITGLVSGQGFDYKIKPESFASSGFADWFTK